MHTSHISPLVIMGINAARVYTELDFMEYASDADAKAKYACPDLDFATYTEVDTGGTITIANYYGTDVLSGGTPSADTELDPSNSADKGCDDNDATEWFSTNTALPHWWQYDFGVGITKVISRITIRGVVTAGDQTIKDFDFQGSNNGSAWTTIYSGQHTNAITKETFSFSNSTPYRYYRVQITSNWRADGYGAFSEVEMKELFWNPSKVDLVGYVSNVNDYVYKDFGADFFDAINVDFEMQVDSCGAGGVYGIALSTGVNTAGINASDIIASLNYEVGGLRSLLIRGAFASSDYTAYAFSLGTLYFGRLTRAAGADTATLKYYSDAARTSQVSTTVTISGLGSSKYRYFYPINHYHQAGAYAFTGYIQNVSLGLLDVFSEATIKSQGSYSLKAVATTYSTNRTVVKTFNTLNLTGKTRIKFDVRASNTGSNIKLGIHDSGGTTSENTPNILVADTFQSVEWDISAVADADKDAIDQLILTVLAASTHNTIYLDNVRYR